MWTKRANNLAYLNVFVSEVMDFEMVADNISPDRNEGKNRTIIRSCLRSEEFYPLQLHVGSNILYFEPARAASPPGDLPFSCRARPPDESCAGY
jgi:hypothetical protein